MSKITLASVGSIQQNPTSAATEINSNFSTIQTAIDNTLSRDGTQPNTMGAPIDMNSQRIVNLPGPVGLTEPVRLTDLGAFTGNVTINAIPVGGTTGQALTKNSNTNYDVHWSSSSGTVTSVALTLPADFTVTGSPVTSTGTLAASFANTPTGTGGFVRQTTPTLITPVLGVATATTINKMQITAPATASILTIADGKSFVVNNGLILAGTDGATLTFQATDTYVGRATTDTLTNKTFDTSGTGNVFKMAGVTITGVTGGGASAVLSASPTLVTPNIGVATGTSLALNGATLGSNSLSVTGTGLFSAPIGIGLTSDGSSVYIRNTISVGSVGGVKSSPTFSGSITNIAGIFIEPTFSSATVGTYYGLSINGPGYTASTVTNFYSLRIGLPTGGSTITQAIYTEGSGRIGFGTSNAQALLHVNSNAVQNITPPTGTTVYFSGADNGFSEMALDSFGTSGLSQLAFRYTRGTGAAPNTSGALQTNDTIANIVGMGNDGSGYSFATAAISYVASGIWTNAPSHPTDIVLSTTAAGSNFASETIRVLGAGNVKFTNAANFTSNGSVATTMTSLGPSGSHTTVQKWLTIVDSGGVTGYIPVY